MWTGGDYNVMVFHGTTGVDVIVPRVVVEGLMLLIEYQARGKQCPVGQGCDTRDMIVRRRNFFNNIIG